MDYRIAKGLDKLRTQVNVKWPNRAKDSDGWIGDTSHAARPSDHNPDSRGIVHALDITHDPAHGFDSYKFADLILKNQDPRLSYVISNRRIGSGPSGPSPGKWRAYNGTNPHDHHCHISITKVGEDSVKNWDIGGADMTPVPNAPPAVESVIIGSTGPTVEELQRYLGCTVTGVYKAGSETEYALRLFQVRNGLDPDGRCGPLTWTALRK